MGHRNRPVDVRINDRRRNTKKKRNFLTLKSPRKNWRGIEHVALLHIHSEAREECKKNRLGGKTGRFQRTGGYLITTSPNCAAFLSTAIMIASLLTQSQQQLQLPSRGHVPGFELASAGERRV